ncbi:hypothetical protein ETD86_35705 [Nonomuraea turkmeniaca]|uniref:Uncharacterized protein n=1 Tax=Nonomuraea turkmeniaca TaxID=103838 RepID=A0A5S4F5E9_9ACTN|nr:hypothetical protein ETD86_35705 [Nonomuraea turkmeniaca]
MPEPRARRHPRPECRRGRRRRDRRPGERQRAPHRALASKDPSVIEICHVLARLFIPTASAIDHVLGWSYYRRLHQHRAQLSHYRRRGHSIPRNLRM